MKVVALDSSSLQGRNLNEVLAALGIRGEKDAVSYQHGVHDGNLALNEIGEADATSQVPRIKAQKGELGEREVCPRGFLPHSCQFARLCVAPDIQAKYALAKSWDFRAAGCEAEVDDHVVPEKGLTLTMRWPSRD